MEDQTRIHTSLEGLDSGFTDEQIVARSAAVCVGAFLQGLFVVSMSNPILNENDRMDLRRIMARLRASLDD